MTTINTYKYHKPLGAPREMSEYGCDTDSLQQVEAARRAAAEVHCAWPLALDPSLTYQIWNFTIQW